MHNYCICVGDADTIIVNIPKFAPAAPLNKCDRIETTGLTQSAEWYQFMVYYFFWRGDNMT